MDLIDQLALGIHDGIEDDVGFFLLALCLAAGEALCPMAQELETYDSGYFCESSPKAKA